MKSLTGLIRARLLARSIQVNLRITTEGWLAARMTQYDRILSMSSVSPIPGRLEPIWRRPMAALLKKFISLYKEVDTHWAKQKGKYWWIVPLNRALEDICQKNRDDGDP